MKYLLITMLWLVALPLSAQSKTTDQQINLQRTILQEQLIEGHILQMDYDRKVASLNHKAMINRTASRSLQQVRGPGGTASITGTVQVAGMNEPGVAIYLYEVGSGAFGGGDITDGAGVFDITGLAAGDYYLLGGDNNDIYIDAIWSIGGTEQCSYCQPSADNIITVLDAQNLTDYDMELVIGASISGQVSVAGMPLDMVNVSLNPADYSGYYGYGTTDIAGNFTIRGVPAGDYTLQYNNNGSVYISAQWTSAGTVICVNCQPDPNGLITIAPAAMLNGFDLALTEGATLTGQITDAVTSAGVETLQVSLYDSVGLLNGYYWTEFDGLGNYTLKGVPQGSYKVYLEPDYAEINEYVPEIYNNIPCNLCSNMVYNGAGDVVTLTNGVITSGINFALDKGASISGAILNGSHLPETVAELGLVYIFNATNHLIATRYLYGTNSDPLFNGSYHIGGLLPGTYFVQGGDLGREFFQRELYDDIRCPWSGCDRGGGGASVALGANEQRIGINFLLEYGGKISGTVTAAATGLPIVLTGNEYVQFYDSTGQVAGGAAILVDGTYVSQRALPPGTYSVRTGSMFTGDFISPHVMQKYHPSGNVDCPGVTCDLAAGNVVVPAYVRQMPRNPVAEAAAATITGIDFSLSPALSFSGTITELGSSSPIPDVHVLVFDDNGEFATWATTDASGDFTVSGLPAGTYYALTNNGSNLPLEGYFPIAVGGWIDILFDGTPCPGSACDVTTGTPIVLGGARIGEGNVVNPVLDFGLSAGGSITGQANIFGSQLPASYVNVNVYNDQGLFYGSYPTDESGHYLTAGFPAGNYYLITSNDGALVNSKYGGDYCFATNCDPLDAVPVVIVGNLPLIDVDFDLRPDYVFKNGLD